MALVLDLEGKECINSFSAGTAVSKDEYDKSDRVGCLDFVEGHSVFIVPARTL